MVSEQEIHQVLTDFTWLNNCHCQAMAREFFVAAGQIITPEALNTARSCPARRQEVIWAYARGIKPGYFGGLSAGQRASMTLEQALEFITTDPPVWPEGTSEVTDERAAATSLALA